MTHSVTVAVTETEDVAVTLDVAKGVVVAETVAGVWTHEQTVPMYALDCFNTRLHSAGALGFARLTICSLTSRFGMAAGGVTTVFVVVDVTVSPATNLRWCQLHTHIPYMLILLCDCRSVDCFRGKFDHCAVEVGNSLRERGDAVFC